MEDDDKPIPKCVPRWLRNEVKRGRSARLFSKLSRSSTGELHILRDEIDADGRGYSDPRAIYHRMMPS